jgi:UDP-N-acetylglucosamine--N-acetylmuramyl-(pentapeptide) pyrophosphoryl-undecaprenol N-acetylglucosamine transferase
MSGGGTGGHLYPGIAVAREIRRRRPAARIVFAGTGRGAEIPTVNDQGFEHVLIRSAGLKGTSWRARVRGLSLLPVSAWDAWRVIDRVDPHLVIGLGGYSAGAVVLLAALRRIPTLVLEQNVTPGITNRLLAPVVSAAAVSHDATLPRFRGKGFVAGNPVRTEFFEPAPPSASMPVPRPAHLLVLGGSQGAHAINVAMMAAAPVLAGSDVPLAVTHQTGRRDQDAVQAAYIRAGVSARVAPFFQEMADIMRRADVVVSRAGATTLAELAAAGRPSVLVPLPGAADGHQQANAEVLADRGAAEVLPEAGLSGERLAARVLALAADDERRRRMGAAARTLARPRAVSIIVDRAEGLIGEANDA